MLTVTGSHLNVFFVFVSCAVALIEYFQTVSNFMQFELVYETVPPEYQRIVEFVFVTPTDMHDPG